VRPARRSSPAIGGVVGRRKPDNFKFGPNPLTISQGTEVTWTNHDDIPHSIVLNALGVHSKAMDTDGKFTYKFDKAGTYFYVCGLHPFMQAKVVVK
jgi:plastocyanin